MGAVAIVVVVMMSYGRVEHAAAREGARIVPSAVRAPTLGTGPALTPAHAVWDYQINEPYGPAPGVTVVSRDRSAEPGSYNICYINALQAQPGAVSWWRNHHPDLLLRDSHRDLVTDRAWREPLLDTSTQDKRAQLLRVESRWIDGCATLEARR